MTGSSLRLSTTNTAALESSAPPAAHRGRVRAPDRRPLPAAWRRSDALVVLSGRTALYGDSAAHRRQTAGEVRWLRGDTTGALHIADRLAAVDPHNTLRFVKSLRPQWGTVWGPHVMGGDELLRVGARRTRPQTDRTFAPTCGNGLPRFTGGQVVCLHSSSGACPFHLVRHCAIAVRFRGRMILQPSVFRSLVRHRPGARFAGRPRRASWGSPGRNRGRSRRCLWVSP